MDTDWSSFVSRDELLGGLPARRASTLLFAIENRTAHYVSRSRRALATYLPETTGEEQERAFLDALAQGRAAPLKPTIQDLERYAPAWASLVPQDPGIRATLAKMIGEKYWMPAKRVPEISQALGLAEQAVQDKFSSLFGTSVDSVYSDRPSTTERWRWMRATVAAKLENLPPFWTAFSLTLTETVGAGILALPIAFAAVGPIAGVIALIVLGLVNVITIAAMAEAVARHGGIRYGRAYFGRMVGDYLGPAGTMLLSPALLFLCVVILLAYFIGLSSTLAETVGLGAEVWAAGLLLVLVYFLRRDSLSATIASALAVGATTISLIVVLSLVALPHVTESNLRHVEVPFLDGRPFDHGILELIFGVVLIAFFGHTTTANCAAVVLERDPSGRSLIRGTAAALLAALGLYCLWVIAVNGSIPPATLSGERGTVLAPLAAVVGPIVQPLGVTFAILAMGMASVHMALALSYQVRDWVTSFAGQNASLHATGRNEASTRRPTVRRVLGSARGRTVAGLAPVVVIFLVVEWLFLSNTESFAGLIGFLGVITAPIVAGIFSMLMLFAARRKGDCAVGAGWRLLGHPLVVAIVSLIFLASIVVHGLFVWNDPLRQGIAILVSLAVVAFVVTISWTAFVPSAVIELRFAEEPHATPESSLVARGTAIPIDIEWVPNQQIPWAANGNNQDARIRLQALPIRSLKVWVHRLTAEGISEGLPSRVEIDDGNGVQRVAAESMDGQIIIPMDGEPCHVWVTRLERDTTIEIAMSRLAQV